jgi:predicted ATPase
MQFTSYFQNDVMVKRPYIQVRWLEQVISAPLRREVQSDGRIRYWAWIDELNRYLRVVTLEDGLTVHNAFTDRRFSP